MKAMIWKCAWLVSLVMLSSSPRGVLVSASDVGIIGLSYDIVGKSTAEPGPASILTVRLKIKNVGRSAIDKVTARVAGTRGIGVDLDHIFFGLIESGETLTSDSFDLVVEPDNCQDVKPCGIVWEVEYWTRYGTGIVEKVSGYLQ